MPSHPFLLPEINYHDRRNCNHHAPYPEVTPWHSPEPVEIYPTGQPPTETITAEGEQQAAQKMSDAAELYQKNPLALKLREFQMITDVAREKNLILVTSATTQDRLGEYAAIAKGLDKQEKRMD
jgi:hypothetical protein